MQIIFSIEYLISTNFRAKISLLSHKLVNAINDLFL